MGAMFTGPMRASHDLVFTLPVVVLIAVLTVVALAVITLAAVALFLLLLLFVATVVLLGVIARGAEPESARDGRGRRQGPYASVTLAGTHGDHGTVPRSIQHFERRLPVTARCPGLALWHYALLMTAHQDTEDRLRMFEAVTDTALAHLDTEQLLHTLLERVRELLGADTAVVLSHDESAGHLVAEAAAGLEEEVRQGLRIPVGEGFAGRVAAQREPVVVDQVTEETVLNPLLMEKGLHVLLGAPMLVNGQLVGVLHVGSRTHLRFTDHDVRLLQVVADRIALAAQAQRSSAERAAATALQRSLLPAHLPDIAGLRFAARYAPGAYTGVGGDWYDVFALPSGRVGIVMGDVAGHGLPSAVVMGRLRSALRAYALETEDPGEVLDKLDRKAIHFEANTMTTVAYAVVDPATHQLQLSLAGHLPPVVGVRGQEAAFVDAPVDPPIGIFSLDWPRRSCSVRIPPDSLFCFYTDGLIERRDSTLDDGLERLRQAIAVGPPERACTKIMSTCLGSEPVEDDVALLVMRCRQGADQPGEPG